jgi:uncharacterized Zn-finger protein
MKISDLLNPLDDEESKDNSSKDSSSIAASEGINSLLQCSECHSTFTRARDLTRHMKSLHVSHDTIWYPCPNYGCDKVFTRLDALRSHLRSKKASVFKCQTSKSASLE